MRKLSDLELLQVEMDLLWGKQDSPELVVACARQGLWPRVSNAVPEQLARSLFAEVERTPPNEDPRVPPARLEQWRIVLEDALGAAVLLSRTTYNWPTSVLQYFEDECLLATRCGPPWSQADWMSVATPTQIDRLRLDRSPRAGWTFHDRR